MTKCLFLIKENNWTNASQKTYVFIFKDLTDPKMGLYKKIRSRVFFLIPSFLTVVDTDVEKFQCSPAYFPVKQDVSGKIPSTTFYILYLTFS